METMTFDIHGMTCGGCVGGVEEEQALQPDPDIAFEFTPNCIKSQRLAR